jgi:nucleotide-binding universal stress UspA family protein
MLIKKILIGVDDSKFSEYAAKYGFDIARTFKAKVGLVNIVEPVIIPSDASADTILGTSAHGLNIENNIELLNIQEDVSNKLIDSTVKKFGHDLEVTHFTQYGSTADGIIACGKEFKADMIIVGTHSRSGLDRFFMGSVAEHIVRHSEIPVLVVPLADHS